VVRYIQTHGNANVAEEMSLSRASWDLIAGAWVVEIEVNSRQTDAGSKFRYKTACADFDRPEDSIERMERGVILETGIVRGSPPPGGRPTNAELLVEKDIDAKMGENAGQPRRCVKRLVAEGIDLVAVGTVPSRAQPDVCVDFLGTKRQRPQETAEDKCDSER
jgi:hypothetical protein